MRGTVFYFTKVQEERANEQFDKILYGYDMLGIKCVKFIKCKNRISVYFENGDFVICRFSGTEPLLRIFAESSNSEKAKEYIIAWKEFLKL